MAWPIVRPFARFFGWEDSSEEKEYHQINSDGSSENLPGYSRANAINLTVVWGAVRVLANTVGGLPFYLYEQPGEDPEIKDRVRPDTLENSRLLNFISRPNGLISRLNYFRSVVTNLALHGNSFAIIHRDNRGTPISLSPILPQNVQFESPDLTDGELLYRVNMQGGKVTLVSPENMLHFKIFSRNGLWGLSPLEEQAPAIGMAQTGRDWAANHMAKGGFPGAYIIFKDFLRSEQEQRMLRKIPDIRKGGISGVGKAAILQGDPKVQQMGMSPRDTQLLESRQYSDQELAGIWGVPISLLNRSGEGNFQQDVKSLMLFGVKPYLDTIKDEYQQKIFYRSNKTVDFLIDDLIFADPEARASYYNLALGGSHGSGWLSQNEVRGQEKRPQRQDDKYNQITHWDMDSGEGSEGESSGN